MLERHYQRFLRRLPRQRRSREILGAIFAAATERLARFEEPTVTVQSIAERAGVSVGSLYEYFADRDSLMAGLVSKITEDNHEAFRARLDGARDQPIDVLVRRILDHAFDLYLADVQLSRGVLRIAVRMNLMPLLAASQRRFADTLVEALSRRADVQPISRESARVFVDAVMGLVHTAVWEDSSREELDALKSACAQMLLNNARAG